MRYFVSAMVILIAACLPVIARGQFVANIPPDSDLLGQLVANGGPLGLAMFFLWRMLDGIGRKVDATAVQIATLTAAITAIQGNCKDKHPTSPALS